MKTYEELFVENVLREMDGFRVIPENYPGGFNGGVPRLFYDTEADLAKLFSNKGKRSSVEKAEDEELSPEDYEIKFFTNLGLDDENRNKRHYLAIKRNIIKGNSLFDSYLKKYKDCKNDKERKFVIRCAICDMQDILYRGCICPADYMFMRRFGLYA